VRLHCAVALARLVSMRLRSGIAPAHSPTVSLHLPRHAGAGLGRGEDRGPGGALRVGRLAGEAGLRPRRGPLLFSAAPGAR
jgi:hypothetical protein